MRNSDYIMSIIAIIDHYERNVDYAEYVNKYVSEYIDKDKYDSDDVFEALKKMSDETINKLLKRINLKENKMNLRKIIREEIEAITRETIEELALSPHAEEKPYYPKKHKTVQDRYRSWKKGQKHPKCDDCEDDEELKEEDDAFDDIEV